MIRSRFILDLFGVIVGDNQDLLVRHYVTLSIRYGNVVIYSTVFSKEIELFYQVAKGRGCKVKKRPYQVIFEISGNLHDFLIAVGVGDIEKAIDLVEKLRDEDYVEKTAKEMFEGWLLRQIFDEDELEDGV